ncbi:hypothetical protein DPMN_182006 [Dreissena polymorpha]|uniref:Uncharacterized protein n=1 Tax=Dreissena polymorpha TaxID=45954 RepID=A0A9D4I4A2_DREPO|nr:hypothetical protein DPMN_182006 [Dreissena polymorpha]
MPGHRESTDLLGDDVSESESLSDGVDDRFRKNGVKTCNLLQKMFGSDATTKADSFVVGISLDNSQISVLRETWRTDKPAKLPAYKDNYRLVFPVSEETDDILAVPSIDTIIGSLLMKKYGQKTVVKSQSLYSQPLKDLEKIAYQGQHASRMGIVINVYMQQDLGNLLSNCRRNNPMLTVLFSVCATFSQ